MADTKKLGGGVQLIELKNMANVNEVIQQLLNGGNLTDEQKKQIREKEAIYQDIAAFITSRVPVSELGHLITWLGRYQESFETPVSFHEEFDTFPQDGAVAVYKALKDKFGFVEHQGSAGGWFSGPTPPEMMTVAIGPNQTIQVPWGNFGIPGYEGISIRVGTHPSNDGFHFCISGQVKKKDHNVILDLVSRIRENLKTSSIYKGKAISLEFDEDFDPVNYSPDDVAPEFLDLSRIDAGDLVLSDNLMQMVQDNLFTPVEKTELCRKFGVPLRRGVLLAGTYGVGKTLASQIQALKATQNGWTFIYLKSVHDLAEGLRVARQYAPAVVFAEDIDAVMSGEDRTDDMNEILNTIDGIEIKGKDVLVVLTTNHVEKINPAMIRPGRIDALIEMSPPDAKAAQKLLRVYGKDLINPTANLESVGKLLSGHRPAMIAETVQRSKLSAISRMSNNETELTIVSADLEAAAHSMNHHVDLVDGKKVKKEPTLIETVGQAIVDTVAVAKTHGPTNGKQGTPTPTAG